eukprot:tig00000473_g1205.t1
MAARLSTCDALMGGPGAGTIIRPEARGIADPTVDNIGFGRSSSKQSSGIPTKIFVSRHTGDATESKETDFSAVLYDVTASKSHYFEKGICCPKGSTWAVRKEGDVKENVHCCRGPLPGHLSGRSAYIERCRGKGWFSWFTHDQGPDYVGPGTTQFSGAQLDAETLVAYAAEAEADEAAGAALEGGDGALAEVFGAEADGAFAGELEAALADRHPAPLL